MHEPSEVDQIIKNLGFNRTYDVTNLSSVAKLFPARRRGIYVLHFANGEHYAGQTSDIVDRFNQHRKRWSDIRSISFKSVRARDLDRAERETITTLDKIASLRNIRDTRISASQDTTLDQIIPRAEINNWLNNFNERTVDLSGTRYEDDRLRADYLVRYDKFMKLPESQEILQVLRIYVQRTIPAPKRTEVRFWVSTCLPSERSDRVIKHSIVLTRINIGRQMTLKVVKKQSQILFHWYVPREDSKTVFGNRLVQLLNGRTLSTSRLKEGHPDQVVGIVEGTQKALKILENDQAIRVFRRFNIGLMQKGVSMWGRYHCLALADHLLD